MFYIWLLYLLLIFALKEVLEFHWVPSPRRSGKVLRLKLYQPWIKKKIFFSIIAQNLMYATVTLLLNIPARNSSCSNVDFWF